MSLEPRLRHEEVRTEAIEKLKAMALYTCELKKQDQLRRCLKSKISVKCMVEKQLIQMCRGHRFPLG